MRCWGLRGRSLDSDPNVCFLFCKCCLWQGLLSSVSFPSWSFLCTPNPLCLTPPHHPLSSVDHCVARLLPVLPQGSFLLMATAQGVSLGQLTWQQLPWTAAPAHQLLEARERNRKEMPSWELEKARTSHWREKRHTQLWQQELSSCALCWSLVHSVMCLHAQQPLTCVCRLPPLSLCLLCCQ